MNLPDIKSRRKMAKNGMMISLGITTLSGLLMKGRTARQIHYAAGAALIGFSVWHHQLYPAARKESRQQLPESAQATEYPKHLSSSQG